LQDPDCNAIYTCAFGDGSIDPPCSTFDADGVACEYDCIAKHPAGKDLYLAQDKCVYCQYCGTACNTTEYCTLLDNPPDAGTDAATDAETDGGTDASEDATTDGTAGAAGAGGTAGASGDGSTSDAPAE
jgi:hypothetical protein